MEFNYKVMLEHYKFTRTVVFGIKALSLFVEREKGWTNFPDLGRIGGIRSWRGWSTLIEACLYILIACVSLLVSSVGKSSGIFSGE